MRAWQRIADQLQQQAAEAEKAGHLRTAGQKYFRAAAYICQAERMLSASEPARKAIYQHCLDLMQKAFDLIDSTTTRVGVPFEGTQLPAYFTDASTPANPRPPVMVMWNGLDSTKEHMYTSGWCHELAARGISTLMVDCPGGGEALRFLGLKARVETEDWAKACVDYLETRSDVDRAARSVSPVLQRRAGRWCAARPRRLPDHARPPVPQQARPHRRPRLHTRRRRGHKRNGDGVPHPRHAVPRAVSSTSVLCVIHS